VVADDRLGKDRVHRVLQGLDVVALSSSGGFATSVPTTD